MPRQSKGARLWLRERRDRSAQWVILDRGREIRTGSSKNDIGTAERALADYIAKKRQPDFGDGNPAKVLVADVLAEYGEQRGPNTKRADLIGGAISKLLDYFGDKTAAEINGSSCQGYVRWRTQQTDARAKREGKSIKATTARRELVVLGAALRWVWKQGKIDRWVPVTLPPQGSPRQRHLNRGEVAALISGALGWDRNGIRHREKINRHVARFHSRRALHRH